MLEGGWLGKQMEGSSRQPASSPPSQWLWYDDASAHRTQNYKTSNNNLGRGPTLPWTPPPFIRSSCWDHMSCVAFKMHPFSSSWHWLDVLKWRWCIIGSRTFVRCAATKSRKGSFYRSPITQTAAFQSWHARPSRSIYNWHMDHHFCI